MDTQAVYRIRLRLTYDRLPMRLGIAVLSLAILIIALVTLLSGTTANAPAPESVASSLPPEAIPYYYLTTGTYNGGQAATACASGYHMASMWEIYDPSALRYNTALGFATSDSGSGPPMWSAWVRTGYASASHISDQPGQANCDAWTTGAASDWGTYVSLNDNWVSSDPDTWWFATKGLCSNELPVWCMQDRPGWLTFIPLVLRQ